MNERQKNQLIKDPSIIIFLQGRQMPFAHVHYRWLKTTNYDYSKRRCCFIAVCLVYVLIFAILGGVFLFLYLQKVNYLNSLSCNACSWLGVSVTSCGHQLCCTSQGFQYSYEYCSGVYGEGIYFILFIVFFSYAIYELFLMICTLCNGSALQNNNQVIIVETNPQYIGLNNYPNQIYQGNQGYRY